MPEDVTLKAVDQYLVGVVTQQIDVFSIWASSQEEAAKKVEENHADVRHHHREKPQQVGSLIKRFELGQDTSGFNFTDYISRPTRPAPEPPRIIIPRMVPPEDLRGGGKG